MRKFFKIILLTLCVNNVLAQLSGTYSVPATYSSIAAAITDLNTQGVNGATTIQISANYTETVPAGGFSLTATGTALNPIVFKKNGTGTNPLLIAYAGGVGTPTTAVQDGMWKLIGSDYITIDGIDFLDQNTTNPATMEYGVGLFKASATNGCRNNRIVNCVITLNRNNNAPGLGPVFEGSKGIEAVNALVNSHTVAVTLTAGSGANSNNQFYANTIQNCHIGIALSGATVTSSSANIDASNEIGGAASTTGNSILNYGAGPGNNAYGVRALNQLSLNVTYNSVNTNTNSGVNLHGINVNACYEMTVANNTISISGRNIFGIMANTNSGGTSVNINNNSVLNCSMTAANFYGIYCGIFADNLNINNNTISGLTASGGSGSIYGFYLPAISNSQYTVSVASNTFQNISNVGLNGSIYGIWLNNGNLTTSTVQSNYMNNVSRVPGNNGALYGIYYFGSSTFGSPVNGYIRNNVLTNLSNGGVNNASETYGISFDTGDYRTQQITGNLINNLTGGTGNSFGIFMSDGYFSSSILSNTVTNVSALHNLYGIDFANYGHVAPVSMNGNIIGNLQSTGSSSVIGINTTAYSFISNKNKIYDLSATGTGSAYVRGIDAITVTGTLSNNMVGNLNAPNSDYSDALAGMRLRNYGNSGTSYAILYNTVRIGTVTSSGLFFGSAALTIPASNATITLRNNILINLSTPNGGSKAIAFQRDIFSNYHSSSNNNIFYAGVPSATNLIYTDGTNNMQTLSTFKTLVTPRESASLTEDTPFLSTTGTSTNFLHISPPSLAESGAVNISGITDDFDGNIRQGNTGYSGNGTAPDIGADEFTTPFCSTVNPSTLTPTSLSVCSGQTIALTRAATQWTILPATQLQWQRSLLPGGPYTSVAPATATSTSYTSPPLVPGTYYYTFASTCSVSTQTSVSNEVTVTVYSYPQPVISPNIPVICTGSSSTVAITAYGAAQFSWSPSTGLSSNTGSMVVANPTVTSTYVLTGINPAGCTGTSNVSVFVYANPTVTISGSTVVCYGSTVALTASGANSYFWSTASTQSVIYPVVTGISVYTVDGRSSPGNCLGTAQFTVSVNPNPTLTANGGTILCAGQSASLSVTGADTYLWSNSATQNTIVVTPPSTTVYDVTGSYSITGCKSTAQQTVTVEPLPVVNITGPTKLCTGETINLNANGATNYSWSTGSTASGITITPTVSTNYSVVGISGPGCSDSIAVSISVNPIPTASIVSGSSPVICQGEAIELVSLSDLADTFNWNHGPTSATIIVSPGSSTTYSLVVKSSLTSCSNTAFFNVAVDPCAGMKTVLGGELMKLQPNPFHLQFSIEWKGVEETQIEVFNSTGSLIMRTNIHPGHNELNMEKFAKGLYYLKLNSEVQKIISE